MIEIIPLEDYYDFYIHLMMVSLLLVVINSLTTSLNDSRNLNSTRFFGYILFVFLIFYMGLRPLSGRYFGDTSTYAATFRYYANGGELIVKKDILFNAYMKLTSSIMGVHSFLTLCCFLYIYPLFKISKALFKEYWFYSFFMFVISFSFWAYGVNGVRNGMATSIFIWGLAYKDNKILHIGLIILSTFVHKTLMLPALIYAITFFYNAPKMYFYFWLLCIPLSIALGGFWENLFASLGFGDDRLSGYLTAETNQHIANTGFRWDFLFYSSGAVAVGFYFILKRDFKDVFYQRIFSTYILSNAFWILVIRANFSNRFAYLSWFLMGIVIIYPYLKRYFFKNQHLVISKVIFVYFMFTYLMSYVYYYFKNK